MGHRGLLSILLIAAGLSALVVATGCGGGSSSTSSGASSAAETTSASGDGEAGNEFAVPGAKNETAEYGPEASGSEREAASVVLAQNLEARAAHDTKVQCASLASTAVKAIEENPQNKGLGCAKALEIEGAKVPEKVFDAKLGDTLEGEIDLLRVKGAKGLAFWHGSNGNDYAMAMEKEDGQWKVAAVLSTVLPKAGPQSKPEAESKPKTPSKSS